MRRRGERGKEETRRRVGETDHARRISEGRFLGLPKTSRLRWPATGLLKSGCEVSRLRRRLRFRREVREAKRGEAR